MEKNKRDLSEYNELLYCPYCNKEAVLASSKEIYNGQDYGLIWICRPCRAYVGCHRGTTKPLGRLANAELRDWKKRVHAVFDPLWKNGKMRRGEAYRKLANMLKIKREYCHIGMFDVKMCERVVNRFRAIQGGDYGRD